MDTDVKKISFIGLGVMGFPMAGHLSNKGYTVTVYNRTEARASDWLNHYSGVSQSTPALAAKEADIVMLCVGNDQDVESVTLAKNGVLETMKPGSILVDHTTTSAQLARQLEDNCLQRQIGFVDAPVSGGQAGADNGQLTIMVGGKQETYDSVSPVLETYAKCVKRMGEAGSGQLAKMMNQICIAGVLQGLSEALHFGKNAGLDCASVVEVISQGAAQSWQMQNRALTMIDDKYDFGFAVDWMRKDLGYALEEARNNGSTLALTALVDQYYADVQRNGHGRSDTSSLLTRLD